MMNTLASHNSNEDSSGTVNFQLRLPTTSSQEAPRRRSQLETTWSGIPTESGAPLEPFGATSSSQWPSTVKVVPGAMPGQQEQRVFRQPSANTATQLSVDQELAGILSATVSVAGPLSRQNSMASYKSSMALTAIESSDVDTSVGISKMSISNSERPALLPEDDPNDVTQTAAVLRASLSANSHLQSGAAFPGAAAAAEESPRIEARKGPPRLTPAEPDLADLAEGLAGATGALFCYTTVLCFYCNVLVQLHALGLGAQHVLAHVQSG